MPSFASLIDVAGEYVYWPVHFEGTDLRALRSGGAPELVATGLDTPNAILVVGSTLYLTDKTGIWSMSVTYDALPRAKTRFIEFPANTTGHSVHFRSEPRLRYSIYFVQRTTNGNAQTSSIYRYSCSLITICNFSFTKPSLLYTADPDWELGGIVSDDTSL